MAKQITLRNVPRELSRHLAKLAQTRHQSCGEAAGHLLTFDSDFTRVARLEHTLLSVR